MILNCLRQKLIESIDSYPERLSTYFKTGEGDYAEFEKFLGVSTPTLRCLAKKFSNLPFLDIQNLLRSKFNEERLLALIILVNRYQKSADIEKKAVYDFYLANLDRVNNWNLVDNSAHHIVGAYLWNKDRQILYKLAQSSNLWHKRVAIVATWYFIKRKDYSSTLEIDKILLVDSHDLIHKACGWMLREVGKQDTNTLCKFIYEFNQQMPRTMLRYAIEKFDQNIRKEILAGNLVNRGNL